jgi:hypothetical protein
MDSDRTDDQPVPTAELHIQRPFLIGELTRAGTASPGAQVLHLEAKVLERAACDVIELDLGSPKGSTADFDAGWAAGVRAVAARLEELAAWNTLQLKHLSKARNQPGYGHDGSPAGDQGGDR